MKEIKLTNSDKVALVDDEDYDFINQFKWHINPGGYAISRTKIHNKRGLDSMHRIILGITDPRIEVDHIFHNRLDNRRSELRICTNSENKMNKSPWGRSKYRGVHFVKRIYKTNNTIYSYEYIIARIQLNHKGMYLGTFPTEESAAKAYDLKAKEYFGEFANLNFK